METILIVLFAVMMGCASPTPATDVAVRTSAVRGDKAHDAKAIKVIAKGGSSVLFIYASDGEVAEIPIDSLLKYYYLSRGQHRNEKNSSPDQ